MVYAFDPVIRFCCNCIGFSVLIELFSDWFRSEPFESNSFNEWVVGGTAPAFEASLGLYNALKELGFTIVLLTGRDEHQRSVTETNLRDAGYSGWERLLLR